MDAFNPLLVTQDPERGFNRSRIKGLIARLVTLKDPATATALEVVAGSRLYQVGHDLIPGSVSRGSCLGYGLFN